MVGCWLYLCAVLSIAALTVSAGPPAGLLKMNILKSRGAQVVGGPEYTTEVVLGRSVRKKRINKDSCPLMMAGESKVFHCYFVVLTVPWRAERDLLRTHCTPNNH